ncbi:hypothetical protein L9F63_018086, partial [Diploptera punctata]
RSLRNNVAFQLKLGTVWNIRSSYKIVYRNECCQIIKETKALFYVGVKEDSCLAINLTIIHPVKTDLLQRACKSKGLGEKCTSDHSFKHGTLKRSEHLKSQSPDLPRAIFICGVTMPDTLENLRRLELLKLHHYSRADRMLQVYR